MNKFIFFLLLFPFLMTQCEELRVENNKRLYLKGKVVDEQGKPLPDIYVHLQGVDYGSETLGYGHTDASGEFEFVSLKTGTNILHVNRKEGDFYYNESYFEEDYDNEGFPIDDFGKTEDSTYTAVDYINVSETFYAGNIQLLRKAFLDLAIKKTSSSDDTLHWKLDYTLPYCVYYFEYSGLLSEEKSSCHEYRAVYQYQEQTTDNPDTERNFYTILGKTAEFVYFFNSDSNLKDTISIPIDERQEEYLFEY